MADEEQIKNINNIKTKEYNKINQKRKFLVSNDKYLLNSKFIK